MSSHIKQPIQYSEQEILNESFNDSYKVLTFAQYVFDPAGSFVPTQTPNTATILDTSASPVLYVGKAPTGSATSSAAWQVAKLDTTSGLVKTWADGNANFDNIWDNRTSLTYS